MVSDGGVNLHPYTKGAAILNEMDASAAFAVIDNMVRR